MKTLVSLVTAFFIFAFTTVSGQTARQKAIEEIKAAEKAFNDMAETKSIQEAFAFFAADDAVIRRGNDTLIYGKAGVSLFYAGNYFKSSTVKWAPDFTDASESGDMGYTYGKYEWTTKDANGKITEKSNGVFHTVWKKQKDGTWKYVWD